TDGEQVFQSVFMDINEWKLVEQRSELLAEQVEVSNQVLHLALEHTTTCEFYYYPQTGICTMPERTCAIYHCRNRYTDMPGSFALEAVDEKSRTAFYEMYERIHRGERTASCEFRGWNG
ncbi:histidine kinase, partial [Eubacteriales bacterium DFI.9.88]|nr:histidine kinase [Eubacteriales bacterium DFI.9.88]